MSSSAVSHVISFLTRPLLAAHAPSAVTSAQLILNASLLSVTSATFSLSPTVTPPPSIHAASIGSGISWDAWFTALGGGRDILLFYGPGYVKVRFGDEQVVSVWSEETQGSVVPISQIKSVPLLQQSTGARLRAMLLSARVRHMRREQAAAATTAEPIRLPSLLFAPTADSDSDASSDSGSDSDCESATSSKFTSYSTESLTSVSSSPPGTPPKVSVALPISTPKPQTPYRASKNTRRVPIDHAKKDLTAYLYQGGVTRVMTGGVMLGPRPAAHVVRSKRS
ncbi:hypothetical protein B0H10DRAFT_2200024 [Mycena sp. CBHHK59/15]|nr:hypothetical protein B0H10DRAFT_2200024 [Mycena sp. CBHHK59/15]